MTGSSHSMLQRNWLSRGFSVLLLTAFISCLPAAEITTGFLIGAKYDSRAFYIRESAKAPWTKTYSGPEYRKGIQGKLFGIQLAQTLFDDEFLASGSFNPNENTDRAIAALPVLKAHGILLVGISMQGANPLYKGAGSSDGFGLGRAQGGTAVSAFRPDGSIKPEWSERLDRFLRAADQHGMAVKLCLFYQGQDEQFDSTEAMLRAAQNTVSWLTQRSHRNVFLSMAMDWQSAGWDFDNFVPQNLHQFEDVIREQFQRLHADFALPILVSSRVHLIETSPVLQDADGVLVWSEGLQIDSRKLERPRILMSDLREVWDEQARQREAAVSSTASQSAAGYLLAPGLHHEKFPFRYLPEENPAGADPVQARLVRSMLDHIAKLTMVHPPRTEFVAGSK